MGLQDAVFVAVTAPYHALHKTSSFAWNAASSATHYLKPNTEIKMPPPVPLWKLAAASGPYVKLAALSGATAVILGALGSHKHYAKDEIGQEQRRIFETANRYHFIHTLALLGLPLCRVPALSAIFMLSGIMLFCGSCYYTAFTYDRRFSATTPIGGFCLILGWCSMLL
ncbi:transmembrane protein 256-like [Ooceraea biroi]|uniref:transmembrane protein 256-like n=1 Tax=Ooceraea biroi TaxID=2015173 RepID=UPI000F07966B|nr:transmembrane protein 256-like [Ooceraea biroi]